MPTVLSPPEVSIVKLSVPPYFSGSRALNAELESAAELTLVFVFAGVFALTLVFALELVFVAGWQAQIAIIRPMKREIVTVEFFRNIGHLCCLTSANLADDVM